MSSMYPSWDRGASLKPGDVLGLHLRQYAAPAGQTIKTFFGAWAKVRSAFAARKAFRHLLPLSEAWRIHETRYNEHYWDEARSYYRVGQPYTLPKDVWTLGWVGGLQASLALLERGSAQSVERVLRNLEFFFSKADQSPAGMFYTVSDGKRCGGDNDCLTWFLADDFRFLAGTTFDRMNMRTRGSCFASVQNKCAVPYICTLSGDAFWKPYRYTSEEVFVDTIAACPPVRPASCACRDARAVAACGRRQ